MRLSYVVIASVALVTLAARVGETADAPAGQAAASATPVGVDAAAAADSSASKCPEKTDSQKVSATANGESPPPAASSCTSETASNSEPITLKMATVPPPADFKPPPGYRAVKRGLDTVYCTKVTPIGTKLPQTYCVSRAQAEQIQRQAEIDRQLIREKAHPGGTSGG
jgi:hypothetical protein